MFVHCIRTMQMDNCMFVKSIWEVWPANPSSKKSTQEAPTGFPSAEGVSLSQLSKKPQGPGMG
jgi:hypothetical protein